MEILIKLCMICKDGTRIARATGHPLQLVETLLQTFARQGVCPYYQNHADDWCIDLVCEEFEHVTRDIKGANLVLYVNCGGLRRLPFGAACTRFAGCSTLIEVVGTASLAERIMG